MRFTIKKFKIQQGLTELRFFEDDVLQFEKIQGDFNKRGMQILCRAWLRGDLK